MHLLLTYYKFSPKWKYAQNNKDGDILINRITTIMSIYSANVKIKIKISQWASSVYAMISKPHLLTVISDSQRLFAITGINGLCSYY